MSDDERAVNDALIADIGKTIQEQERRRDM